MKNLTRFEANTAEAVLSAIPFKNSATQLSGGAVAAIAMSMVALREVNNRFTEAVRGIAQRVKPDGFDTKAAEREAAMRELFGDGEVDAAVWAERCPDKEFEAIYVKADEDFQTSVNELGHEKLEVDLRLTADHLEEIASVVLTQESVMVNGSEMPVQQFMYLLATLI